MQKFRTYQLAKELFHKSASVKLKGAMRDQFERAALSIPLNLSDSVSVSVLGDGAQGSGLGARD